jgi:2-dehydro-3-deoxyphosphogluconate aldolase/(4S)-4-hydroxy-2-oxoglutarate aldolase
MCHVAWNSGIELVEVPVAHSSSVPSLIAAVDAAKKVGRFVGAGSVVDVDQWETAINVGAQFTVAPGFVPAVIARSVESDIPHLPGVATSSEISQVLASGNRWMKAFPAAQLGASWIQAQLQPFPSARFMATGGINKSNAQSFMSAGAIALGLGSQCANAESLSSILGSI